MRKFDVFLVCLVILTVTDCQTLVYYCNFDAGLVNDCVFNNSTGVFALTTTSGVIPTHLKPTEPLSDVTSVQLLTTPNNKPCILPYDYPTGNWSMYFCKWNSPTNFTCPTASGMGNCIIGKYAHFKNNVGNFDTTYLTNVSTKSNTVHCLDFFYYLTDASDAAKISFGWKSNETITTIVEVAVLPENRWQQSRTTYTSPASEMHQIWFRMTRHSAIFRMFTYALDEIKIFEGSCESNLLMVIPFAVLNTTTSADRMKRLAIDDDVQTTTIFKTTDEEMNMTTSNTSDVNFTTTTIITSETRSVSIQTATTSDFATFSFTKKTDLVVTLGVSLGFGIPALIITIGGLFYQYRQGQLKSNALYSIISTNEIPMTIRNA